MFSTTKTKYCYAIIFILENLYIIEQLHQLLTLKPISLLKIDFK